MNNPPQNKSLYFLSVTTFLIYLFFAFWTTSLPFRDEITSPDEITSSNVINQILNVVLFFSAIICLFAQRKSFLTFILKEKFLSIIIIYFSISIAWSNFPFVSFKRLFQLITTILVITSFLLYTKNEEDRIKYILYILFIYLTSSIFVVFTIPGAIDPDFGTWRGFAPSKNVAGQIYLVSFILSFTAIFFTQGRKRLVVYMLVVFSIILLIGTTSSTAVLTFTIILFIIIIMSLNRLFFTIGIKNLISSLIIFSGIFLILSIYFFEPDIWKNLPAIFGKDTSFTGRTDLWVDILLEAKNKLLFGVGYQAFWTIENPVISRLYDYYVWLPNQAHNGYIDLLNETGIIGLFFLLLLLVTLFYRKIKRQVDYFWFLLPVACIIINLQESTFFLPGSLISNMFIYSYLTVNLHYYKNYLINSAKT